MADASLLSILAGTDPQAANMLAASQGLQLQNAAVDPSFGHNEGIFGALAKTIAGVRGSNMANDAVRQIVQARQAALPELAKIYGTGDPLKTLSEGSYSPTTLSMALAGVNPLNAAQSREAAANAALAGLNVSGFQRAQAAQGGVSGAPAGISAPASKTVAPPASAAPSGDLSVLGTGRYPQQQSQEVQGATPVDPVVAAASMSPQQRQQLVSDPQKRAVILQRLRALAAQNLEKAASGEQVPTALEKPPLNPPT